MSERGGAGVSPYRLKRSSRRTLAISVLPDGNVEVVAPISASVELIEARIRGRAGWIARQRRAFVALRVQQPERRYCTGATHRYLGRQYRLKVSKAVTSSVKLIGGHFLIGSPDPSPAAVAGLLRKWLRVRAALHFERRLAGWRDWCLHRNLPVPRLVLRRMPKRWGSAGADGRIALNPELIHAPSDCMDYVIAHEICHLKHRAHDARFFRLLSSLCPAWRNLKLRLETTSP
jgi:predicted metal-dependent hydrolase